jgi:hypothetical protein
LRGCSGVARFVRKPKAVLCIEAALVVQCTLQRLSARVG